MEIWREIVASICLVGVIGCILLMIRNHLVYKLSIRLLMEESSYTRQRINDGKGFDTFRRNDALPSYGRMVLKFWIPIRKFERPLSDFYKD